MDFSKISDAELEARLKSLASGGRQSLVELLQHLTEFGNREIALRGARSLYRYCVDVLRFAENEAANRIMVARAAERFPALYGRLASGELSLTTARMIAPHLQKCDAAMLIRESCNRSLSEIDRLLASLGFGEKAKRDRIQAVGTAEAPRFQYRFSVDEATHRMFKRAKQLLWHKNPKATMEEVFSAALSSFIDKHAPEKRIERRERKKMRVRPLREVTGRRIPQSVRDAVYKRDGHRCTFLAADGHRCEEVAGLEIDHIKAWALGGRSNDPKNLRLLCRGHNQLLARETFGAAADFRA